MSERVVCRSAAGRSAVRDAGEGGTSWNVGCGRGRTMMYRSPGAELSGYIHRAGSSQVSKFGERGV